MMAVWRKRLGQEIKERRGTEKQESFANRIKISRAQLSIIERGARSYSIDPVLQILAGVSADPVATLVSISKGLNSLEADAIEACHVIVEAFADGRGSLVKGLVDALQLRTR
jgi:transcriptional regulator with XRE-family HTH domain